MYGRPSAERDARDLAKGPRPGTDREHVEYLMAPRRRIFDAWKVLDALTVPELRGVCAALGVLRSASPHAGKAELMRCVTQDLFHDCRDPSRPPRPKPDWDSYPDCYFDEQKLKMIYAQWDEEGRRWVWPEGCEPPERA